MDLKDLGVEQVKMLDSTPPEGSPMVNSLTLEATVDVNPQPLRKMLPYHSAARKIPSTIPAEAQIVLQGLLACFEKQGDVSEGLIGDIIWGFEAGKIPPECTYTGLKQLAELEYLKFQATDNSYVDITSDSAQSAWVRYQQKLLNLIYE